MSSPNPEDRAHLQAALEYAALGFPVFPLHFPVPQVDEGPICSCLNPDCSSPCKHPLTKQGFKDASCDPETVADWWAAHPRANIGIAVPSGFIVLDVDTSEAMAALQAHGCDLPSTATQRTPRGGWHYLLRVPAGVHLEQVTNKPAPGIDTRVEGKGYFVAAPSVGLIKAGHTNSLVAYEWTVSPHQCEIAPAPEWMLETYSKGASTPYSVVQLNGVSQDLILKGARNDTLFRSACRWRQLRLSPAEATVLMQDAVGRCEQPIGDRITPDDGCGILDRVYQSYYAGMPEEAVQPLRVLNYDDFLTISIPPRETILDGLIRSKDLAQVYSRRGTGKTWFSVGVAVAVSSGAAFLRFSAPEPRGVLIVDGEMAASDLQERVRMSLDIAGLSWPSAPLKVLCSDLQAQPMAPLNSREAQLRIEEHLEGIELLILDNLSCLFGGAENDAETWEPAQRWLLSLRRRGIAVLFLHHSGKDESRQRGTSKREDVLNTVILLKQPTDYDSTQGARFEVHYDKNRNHFDSEPFEAWLKADDPARPVWAVTSLRARNYDQVLEMTRAGMPPSEIAKELGVNRSTVYRHQRRAAELGELPVTR